ncbi:MAG TPA: hypothetical protein DCP61_02000 [Treponema sp.]|nr:hypothetical protein [Treponema sp.]
MTAYFIFVVLRTGHGGTTGFLRDKARQALEGPAKGGLQSNGAGRVPRNPGSATQGTRQAAERQIRS